MVNPRDLLGGGKEAIGKRLMAQMTPSEEPIAQALAPAIVSVENQQAQAVEELVDAADLDVAHGHDPEARREALLETADAVANQRFVPAYLELALGLEDAGPLEKYVGLDDLEEQKREWWEMYRENGMVDEPVDDVDQEDLDDLAQRHVGEMFGISLTEFEEVVAGFDQAEAARSVLAGPIVRHTQIIAEAAEAVQADQERLEELEERVDELEDDADRAGETRGAEVENTTPGPSSGPKTGDSGVHREDSGE